MKLNTILACTALAASMPRVLGWPGMKSTLGEVQRLAAERRQETADPGDADGDGTDPADDEQNDNSGILLGDLLTLNDSQLTLTGADIKSILVGIGTGLSDVIDTSVPPRLGTAECAADTCCVWKWISFNMVAAFRGTSGRCNSYARAAVRMGFHDAGAWSNTSTHGGADGSLLLSDELTRSENDGLQEFGSVLTKWFGVYKQFGISMADLIQFGATVATVTCPLGPRIKTYVGRPDNSAAAPENLLPDVNAPADVLIELFENKTIAPHQLAALVGAHSTSQQFFVNTSRAGDPQDSTPGVWDVLFYNETLTQAPDRVFKFPSDVVLSTDPRVNDEWVAFIDDQSHWNSDFADAYVRLSLLGVPNVNELTECTQVLPPAITNFTSLDQPIMDLWLQGQFTQLSDFIDQGAMLSDITSSLTPTTPQSSQPEQGA